VYQPEAREIIVNKCLCSSHAHTQRTKHKARANKHRRFSLTFDFSRETRGTLYFFLAAFLLARILSHRSHPHLLLPPQRCLDAFHLRAHADKRTENYSGGNKRKLSLAVALIGAPRVVLLDGTLRVSVCMSG
jgi:ABC-type Na+ transport system ATPase subunit NatA